MKGFLKQPIRNKITKNRQQLTITILRLPMKKDI